MTPNLNYHDYSSFPNPNQVVRCFFATFPSWDWFGGPLIADAPPLGVKSLHLCSRVKIFRMLGDGVTSSSVSSAAEGPSQDPSSEPKCSVVGIFCFFWRVLCFGYWLLSAILSVFLLHGVGVILLSRIVKDCEGGCPHCSTIMQSGGGGCEACATRAFLRSGVLVCFRVSTLSNLGDWIHPDLAERSIFILRT